jgi:hypothetical protein
MRLAEEHPAHVRPEAADARRVRILRLIGMLVVQAVRGDPEIGLPSSVSVPQIARKYSNHL